MRDFVSPHGGDSRDRQTTLVAVKTVKTDASECELLDLVREAELMKYLGKHENILNLIGCSTQNGFFVKSASHHESL